MFNRLGNQARYSGVKQGYMWGVVFLCMVVLAQMASATGNPRSFPSLMGETSSGFPLMAGGLAVPIIHDTSDAKVVEIAVDLLADDIESVTGTRPAFLTTTAWLTEPIVIAGTIESSSFADDLITAGTGVFGALVDIEFTVPIQELLGTGPLSVFRVSLRLKKEILLIL